MTHVLVYRTLGLGDFLTALPAYHAVRRAFRAPEHVVTLAAPAALRPLAALTGAFDRFAPTSPLRSPSLVAPPSVSVNLHGKGPESHRVLLRARSRRLVAFRCRTAGVSGPAWCGDEHEVARWCRLLRESGITADETELDLPAPQARARVTGVTVVHPGAADPARRWPAARYGALARCLERQGHRVVVTGVHDERALVATVVHLAGLPADRGLAGQLGLDELAALVAAARLVVCGDTGVGHLATAYRIPSVLLFSTSSPEIWGPPLDRPWHRVIWPTAPRDRTRSRLLAIGVDEVVAGADAALAAAGPRVPAG